MLPFVDIYGSYESTPTQSRDAQLAGDAWMVQPKAIVEAWLGPRVTLGAFAASDPGDWATGIFVGIGQRRLKEKRRGPFRVAALGGE